MFFKAHNLIMGFYFFITMDKKEISNKTTTLYVKNMVCNRCIKVVKEELEKLSYDVCSVILGEAVIKGTINDDEMKKIKNVLEENGFELIEDKRKQIIEQIKITIIKAIYEEKIPENVNFSSYLSKELDMDYHYLSTLFSSIENITIEHYIILQKIERAKELLKYGELTLSEISYKLGYSSVQHLSNQFKKVTGFTASKFKELTDNIRQPIDKIKS